VDKADSRNLAAGGDPSQRVISAVSDQNMPLEKSQPTRGRERSICADAIDATWSAAAGKELEGAFLSLGH
jgi:hypothetical protein